MEISHLQDEKIEWRYNIRLPLIGLGVLFVVAILIPHPVWNALIITLGGLLLISYAWVRLLADGLRGERQLRSSWVAVGDQIVEMFVVRNNSQVPALWVEVADQSRLPGYKPSTIIGLGITGGIRWRQTAICTRRGRFTIGPWHLRTGDPFGLFEVIVRYHEVNEVIIHPPIYTDLPLEIPAGMSEGRTRRLMRTWQATVNAASVREYRPKDPLKHIHWPTTARRGELAVREFDRDAAGDIWLVLDLDENFQFGEGANTTEEHAVVLAASLSARSLASSRAVGLAAYGELPQLIPPSRGQGQQWRILEGLALVSADKSVGLDIALRDLRRTMQRGAAALIITPRVDGAWLADLSQLARLGIAVSVVLLDPESYGGVGKCNSMRDEISRLGVPCTILTSEEIHRDVLKEREKQQVVTPFGRTVDRQTITLAKGATS